LVGGILALRHNVFEAELAIACGIFATLGEYFCPITLLGDFPVRMSQLEHVGACGMGVETILRWSVGHQHFSACCSSKGGKS
jgi:hypothetical protein